MSEINFPVNLFYAYQGEGYALGCQSEDQAIEISEAITHLATHRKMNVDYITMEHTGTGETFDYPVGSNLTPEEMDKVIAQLEEKLGEKK